MTLRLKRKRALSEGEAPGGGGRGEGRCAHGKQRGKCRACRGAQAEIVTGDPAQGVFLRPVPLLVRN